MYCVAAFLAYQLQRLLLGRLRLLPLYRVLLAAIAAQLPFMVPSAPRQRPILTLLIECNLMLGMLPAPMAIRVDRGWNLQLRAWRELNNLKFIPKASAGRMKRFEGDPLITTSRASWLSRSGALLFRVRRKNRLIRGGCLKFGRIWRLTGRS